jgi:hypothetical protein
MKPRRSIAVAVLALLGALLFALPASSVTPTTDASTAAPGNEETPLLTLKAFMTGEKEVPGPGDPDGRGTADIEVYRAEVCYTLKFKNIEPATAAHIHIGLRREAGPVLVTLFDEPTEDFSMGCVEIPRALSLELIEHPGRYYVNVHNEPFPAGAIRGQLHR